MHPPPELRWAGLGGNRETRSLYAPSLVLEFRADGPALGMERAQEGQRLGVGGGLPRQPGDSLHLCVSSWLSSWRVSGPCSFGPCKEASQGRGWRHGWALAQVGCG